MQNISHPADSYWSQIKPFHFPALTRNAKSDVLVIGAGVVGLVSAYHLTKSGKKVIVVDAKDIGGGQTEFSTAHLTWVIDKRYAELKAEMGKTKARLILDSHKSAIDFLEDIIRDEKIECDFKRVDGYLFSKGTKSKKKFEKELKVLHELGAAETELHAQLPKGFKGKGYCLRFPRQAQFHPLKFLNSLAQYIVRNGGRIYSDTSICHIDSEKARTENGKEINAAQIVVATLTPIQNIFPELKAMSYRSYVIGIKIKKSQFPESLYWEDAQPYHYVRTQPMRGRSHLLIIGGEDHKSGKNDNEIIPFKKLKKWTLENIFLFKKIDYAWSGRIIASDDGLAFIGRSPSHKNIYLITGDSGNGITYAAIAARIIHDSILNKKNDWADIYSPSRTKTK